MTYSIVLASLFVIFLWLDVRAFVHESVCVGVGTLPIEEIKRWIREEDVHHPITSLVCLETTQVLAHFVILSVSSLKDSPCLHWSHVCHWLDIL